MVRPRSEAVQGIHSQVLRRAQRLRTRRSTQTPGGPGQARNTDAAHSHQGSRHQRGRGIGGSHSRLTTGRRGQRPEESESISLWSGLNEISIRPRRATMLGASVHPRPVHLLVSFSPTSSHHCVPPLPRRIRLVLMGCSGLPVALVDRTGPCLTDPFGTCVRSVLRNRSSTPCYPAHSDSTQYHRQRTGH